MPKLMHGAILLCPKRELVAVQLDTVTLYYDTKTCIGVRRRDDRCMLAGLNPEIVEILCMSGAEQVGDGEIAGIAARALADIPSELFKREINHA